MTTADQVDVLAFGAHPDDVELWCGGVVCTLTAAGYSVGVVDLTRGELGSRGSVERRQKEAADASGIMSLSVRLNLGMADGGIMTTPESRLAVIRTLRALRPRVVLVGATRCRHPDHEAATRLVAESIFYGGLRKIETSEKDGRRQDVFRPDHVLHYMQTLPFEPTLVVDVSDAWPTKLNAVRAYSSQFFNPSYKAAEDEPETYVSNEAFLKWIEARARSLGYPIGAEFAEGLQYRNGPMGVSNIMQVLDRRRVHQ